jgi:hypothetical protein
VHPLSSSIASVTFARSSNNNDDDDGVVIEA